MRKLVLAASAILLAGAATLAISSPASAHVAPSTTIQLDVNETYITAGLTLPVDDLATASGIAIPDATALDPATEAQIAAYLEQHFSVSSGDDSWSVVVNEITAESTEQWGTGTFPAITATATLTPTDTSDLRSFDLDYDAIIHQVVSADIYVTLHKDWAAGDVDSARDLGTISLDTITGTVPALQVNLDDGSAWQGFVGMVSLGISHIAEGTDHQLFLLTLLLPAPLLAVRNRWSVPATTRSAIRRITGITLAFTVGHSLTLALGALGLAVPQQPVEALIAVSILVAAAHALRPIFPGREALVAGLFGLVHGMAFSTTLSELDLSGWQLVLSLLGFNLGVEIMQLTVVALVLPPLLLMARTRVYTPLRIGAGAITGLAAVGWLLARLGLDTPLGTAADSIGGASLVVLAGLWAAAVVLAVLARRQGLGQGTEPNFAARPRVDAEGLGSRRN